MRVSNCVHLAQISIQMVICTFECFNYDKDINVLKKSDSHIKKLMYHEQFYNISFKSFNKIYLKFSNLNNCCKCHFIVVVKVMRTFVCIIAQILKDNYKHWMLLR